ncbi:AAA family ATPase [Plesiomonas shigelloides]|uniref:AAA family ATPase n=1 Tax=Plesiomonas shigelloides TaxID=703 RepID=UPI001261847E|nr:AAA family ATPase [Plesiomonas shigelloides]KAB7701710.1 AAA family ATPase [Plesiomonas shigelloides]
MKIIRAKFKNFRLLKDLELKFSIDDDKRLTVIRAANETGKTTTLTALIWALYGSNFINKKNGLHSATAINESGVGEVDIEVEVEFLTEEVVDKKGSASIEQKHYRLIRKCTELVNKSSYQRIRETQTLFLVKPTGDDRILDSEVNSIIERTLPKNLKDIYFTDGDSAMSFIEASADQRIKRRRVQSAIESLLSMDTVKDLILKLEKVRASYGRSIEKGDLGQELTKLNEHRCNFEEFLEGESVEIDELSQEKSELKTELNKVNKKIEEALKLGDREKLLNEIKKQEIEKKRLNDLQYSSRLRLTEIISKNKVASHLIEEKISPAIEILQKLKSNRQLPKQSIPVLSELLDAKVCFCGSDLSSTSEEGVLKRKLIEDKIKNSEKSDKLNAIATELYYSLQGDPINNGTSKNWIGEYEKCMDDESKISKQLQETQGFIERLENDVSQIKDDYLQNLKSQQKILSRKIEELVTDISSREYECKNKKSKLVEINSSIDSLKRKLDKKDNSSGKYKLVDDLRNIFSNVFESIKTSELEKVSKKMNEIFLSMIGSDPVANPNTMIQKAVLTEKFDIEVYGVNGHKLDPDEDLNGASRRAITLAFILALTKVSKVDAANIIDTPLGMMSGYVKRSVLKNLINESKQIVLFLTHSEISGIEDIIDEHAGEICTLTNPGHYPLQLVNKPHVEESSILLCSCDHRNFCSLCERKTGELS